MKKIFIFISLVVLILFSFSSCRIKGITTQKEDYSGVVLKYYKMDDDRDVIEPIIAEYIQTKRGLNIQYRSFSDYEEYSRLILNEMAEGEGPDIFSMPNTWFATNYKKLSPMPLEFGSLNDFDTLFVDVATKDLVQVDVDGVEKIFGIPMTIDTLAIYYNKSHFEDRLPAQGRPSNTWDALLRDVYALTVYDQINNMFEVSGIAMGTGSNINYAIDILYALILQYGIDFYDDKISTTRFASMSGTGGMNLQGILTFYSGFSNRIKREYTWNFQMADMKSELKEIEAFVKGDVSMIIGYSSTFEKILKQIGQMRGSPGYIISREDIRVAPFPQISDIGAGAKRVAYANYYAEAVSRNTQHSELAWDFLVFLTQRKNLQTYFEKTKKPTSRRDMIEEQLRDPIYGIFVSQIGIAESFPIVDKLKYREIFTNMLDFIAEGGDIVKAYKDAELEINKMLYPSGYRTTKIN